MHRYELAVEISEEYDFHRDALDRISENRWIKNQYPLVYLIKNDGTRQAYVGESTNGLNRIKNHLANDVRTTLNKISIIGSDKFNKSATLDIESQLIQYLHADQTYKLQNGNAGLTLHNYYQRDLYRELFKEIWRKLSERKITSRSLEEIENSAIFKYSPFKSLNADQYNSVLEIIENLSNKNQNTIVVNGSAGTGKTILATYLVKLLVSLTSEDQEEVEGDEALREFNALKSFREKYPKPKIGLVIAMTSLRETLQTVFEETPGLKASMVISPSQAVGGDYDLLLVDEAHRLRQRKNISWMGAFDNNNRKLGLGNEGNELDWIMKSSRNQVFFYDATQSVKPSDISKGQYDAIFQRPETIWLQLKSQMRVIGGNDYIGFVGHLLDGQPDKLRDIELDKSYELLFFDSFTELYEQLRKREEVYKLSRLIAGYSWFWASQKDPAAIDIVIENLEFQWNRTPVDWINSPNAFREIGCIHTTQGYDLNYAGIIFGEEITYDHETGHIEIIKDRYFDKYGRQGTTDEELKEYIVNIYKTIMYRGIRGTFIYACDPAMRSYLKAHLPNYRADFPFRIIAQEDIKPYVNAVPVLDLKAAAGGFSDLQRPETLTWIELQNTITPREGYFVSQVIGDSMLPEIPNGAWCLFTQDQGGSREGKTVLVQHYSIQDELGSGYTVKEYHSSKVQTEEGWRHDMITLSPKNVAFEPIVLKENELEDLKVIGIFHSVLEV